MTVTILVRLGDFDGSCQRGPAGQCQKDVSGDEDEHYRGRDKERMGLSQGVMKARS